MFKFSTLLALGASAAFSLTGCQKSQDAAAEPQAISAAVRAQVAALGFDTNDLKAVSGGYLAEGDMLLTPELLASTPDRKFLRVGEEEQYRTTNLVTGLPRTLTVSLSTEFPASYVTAIDEAIRRYNDANLQLHFTRITSGTADLPVKYSANLGAGVLGFTLVPSVIGTQTTNAIATIMAHEMGHCIGLRHTDYMNRAYSCGRKGQGNNEGTAGVGAILIPGTPSAPDPNSWMLACVGTNVDRPFNANDVIALNYLY
jgi:hypothetical protein